MAISLQAKYYCGDNYFTTYKNCELKDLLDSIREILTSNDIDPTTLQFEMCDFLEVETDYILKIIPECTLDQALSVAQYISKKMLTNSYIEASPEYILEVYKLLTA